MGREPVGAARRAARRVVGSVSRRLADPQSAEAADVSDLRRRLRRTRAKLMKLSDQNEALREELRRTRGSVRNPFPDLVLGDRVLQVIEGVRAESLSYLSADNLAALAAVVAEGEQSKRPGLVIEAGTALGGSAIVMAAAKEPTRAMRVYDVFGMIPPPSEHDGADVHRRYERIRSGASKGIGDQTYYGYRDDLLTEVTASFARHGVPVHEHNVELVQGLFQDTLHVDEPVAFAHLDGDWYESTKVCLERIVPHLVGGGRIVLDDYYQWSGCRRAVDEYFRDRPGFRMELRARLHVIRQL